MTPTATSPQSPSPSSSVVTEIPPTVVASEPEAPQETPVRTVEVQQTPQPYRRTGHMTRRDGVSIRSSAPKETTSGAESKQSKVVRDKTVNEADLQREWFSFANEHADKVILAQTMRGTLPSLQEDGVTFKVTLMNELQKSDLEEIYLELRDYLTSHLENDRLKMVLELAEMDESMRIKSLPELWQQLLEENNDVVEMVERLKLTLK